MLQNVRETIANATKQLERVSNSDLIVVERDNQIASLKQQLADLSAKYDRDLSEMTEIVKRQSDVINRFTLQTTGTVADKSVVNTASNDDTIAGDFWGKVADTVQFNRATAKDCHIVTLGQYDSNVPTMMMTNKISGQSVKLNGVPNQWQKHIISVLMLDVGYFRDTTLSPDVTSARSMRYLSDQRAVLSASTRNPITGMCGRPHGNCNCIDRSIKYLERKNTDSKPTKADDVSTMLLELSDSKPPTDSNDVKAMLAELSDSKPTTNGKVSRKDAWHNDHNPDLGSSAMWTLAKRSKGLLAQNKLSYAGYLDHSYDWLVRKAIDHKLITADDLRQIVS